MLVEKVDLIELKETWLEALSVVADFFNQRNSSNVGCLYYSRIDSEFIAPEIEKETAKCKKMELTTVRW